MESRQRIFKDAKGNITSRYAEEGKLGRYPQNLVENEKLIETLNGLVKREDFKSFGYLSEDGPSFYEKAVDFIDGGKTSLEEVLEDKPTPKESMLYIDLEWENKKYRGVLIENYRYRSFTKRNRFALRKVYWFSYEDISWVVQDEDEESLTLSPSLSLDSQPFSLDNGTDYKVSSIRKWLNSDFLNLAFDQEEKEILLDTDLGEGVVDKAFLPGCEILKEEGSEGENLRPLKYFSYYALINGGDGADIVYWMRHASYSGGVEVVHGYNYSPYLSNRAARDSSVGVAPLIRVKKDAFRERNPMNEGH